MVTKSLKRFLLKYAHVGPGFEDLFDMNPTMITDYESNRRFKVKNIVYLQKYVLE
jgi:hypothetical protein